MAITFNDYMPIIWNKLKGAGMTDAGAAGMMGNLYAESGCTPYACQPSRPYSTCMTYIANVDNHTINEYSFVHRGCSSTGGVASGQGGFGLAQWTYYSRKQNLYNFWGSVGSIGDIYMQCNFLIHELQTSYPSVWNVLISTESVNVASNAVLHDFEKPANQSSAVEALRQGYSTEIYTIYNGTTPTEPPTPQPPSVDPPEPEPQDPIQSYEFLNKRLPIWEYPVLRF